MAVIERRLFNRVQYGTLSGGWLIVGDRPTQVTIRSGPTVVRDFVRWLAYSR